MAEETKRLTGEDLARIMEMMERDRANDEAASYLGRPKPMFRPTAKSLMDSSESNPSRGIREIKKNPLEMVFSNLPDFGAKAHDSINQIIDNTFSPIEAMIKEQNTYKEMQEAGLPLAGESEQDNINVLMNFIKSAPFAGLMKKIRGI